MREVVGNAQAQAVLERALATGEPRQAYLLYGPAGVGKLTLALAFAHAALCQRRQPGESQACGECAACRRAQHGNHPDLTIIEPPKDKRWLPIDSVREVRRIASLAPSEGAYRIIIFPEVERIQERTANTLLKTLEEPPEGVIIFLLTTDLESVLPTIVSRCQLIAMRPLAAAEVAQALRERWSVAPDTAKTLAGLANGRLGWAVRAFEHPEEQEERAKTLERIVTLVGAPIDERMRIAATLGSDNATARVSLDLWIAWWRDVTLAANHAHGLTSAGAVRQAAERVGVAIGPESALRFLDELLNALSTMDINANPRLTLENLALSLPSARRAGARQ